jgi:biotin-dependent carboxylase-like uncharacterized protein
MRSLQVLETGLLATVQDLGRPGLARVGVGRSGAADRGALRLGNRLLGNDEGCAGIEVTLGGLALRAEADLLVAVTGAPCPVTVDTRPAVLNGPVRLPAGAQLRLATPTSGLRSYVTARGGLDVAPVLGSRSTDVLAGLGPEVLASGDLLPVAAPPRAQPLVDVAPVPPPAAGEVLLRVRPGPRADWFADQALATLTGNPYEVSSESNRVGARLLGPVLARSRDEELPSEGMVAGALQVPPSGQPTLFLADHPVTGGYPVLAVVVAADLDLAAQLRPGQAVRFKAIADRAG